MIIASSWQGVGVNALLFTIGLQAIPKEPLEAARIDGAGGPRLFTSILWPMLRPLTAVVVGLSIVASLKTFDIVWGMTKGGPGTVSETLALTMYKETFVNSDYGLGSAIAVFLTVITLIASVLYLRQQLLPEEGDVMSKIIRTAVLVLLGIVWLLPAYLLVVNAMKDPLTFTSKESWIPTDFHLFENFGQALELSGIGDSIVSTLIYSIVSPTIAVLVGAAAGFAIVALRLKRGFLWFVVIFGGTVFPLQMVLLPLFDAYSRTGLFDTRLGMIMIYTVISIPFSAFVMRNFFTGVAHNVFEAAVLDGATTWRIFTRMYLPMASSALVAIFILQATFVWNDLLLGLTLSQSDDIRPIITTLSGMQSTYGGAQMSVVLAAAVLVSLPTVVLFLCTQRFFAKGLALGQY